MSKLIPERPLYHKERLLAGFPALAVFALLFLTRLLIQKLSPAADPLWLQLIALPIVFVLPAAFFLTVRGKGYTRVLRLRPPLASQIPFLIASFFALLCGALLLSILCGGMESLGNSATAFETAPATSLWRGIAMTVVLAILPALLEEFFFRGILIAEYERRGGIRAVCMSSLLFALCHFDLRNLLVYLFTGILLALVLFATDSLLATVLLHICYNIVSLFGQRYLNALYSITGSVELFLFVLILILLVSLLFFCRTGARLYRRCEQAGLRDPRRDVPWNVQFYTILDALADPPVILCFILSIVGFILL